MWFMKLTGGIIPILQAHYAPQPTGLQKNATFANLLWQLWSNKMTILHQGDIYIYTRCFPPFTPRTPCIYVRHDFHPKFFVRFLRIVYNNNDRIWFFFNFFSLVLFCCEAGVKSTFLSRLGLGLTGGKIIIVRGTNVTRDGKERCGSGTWNQGRSRSQSEQHRTRTDDTGATDRCGARMRFASHL